jgi:dihydroorotate dehydrogenase
LTGGINDYAQAFGIFAEIGSFTTVNISCPNAFGGQPFTEPEMLEALLFRLEEVPTKKPTFVKFSPDLDFKKIDELLEVIGRHKIQGIICSNLTKDRNNKNILETNLPQNGGLSGKVVEKLADELIAYVYKKTKGKYVVVGCGGVFSAEDAYKKIRLGASLIQLITGMIYEGPQVIGEINAGLEKLLLRDGFKNISEAVGVDCR